MITDEEFITHAIEILNKYGCRADVCNAKDTLHFGFFCYMTRAQLVKVSEEMLRLDKDGST